MRTVRLCVLALVAFAAAGCTEVGERTQLSVGYYSISGRTFDELDEQIALHGPSVTGVGRALAATNVRMVPEFAFEYRGGKCHVKSARVRVQAHVTLPRLDSTEQLKRGLSQAWNNLEQYARLHESVHVSIADNYALAAEKIVRELPPEADCETLRTNAVLAFRGSMAEHEREQIRFDEEERERITALILKSRRDEAEAKP